MELMTKREAAAYLRCGVRTLDLRVKEHEVAYYMMGGRKMFDRADLDKYIERTRVCSRYDSVRIVRGRARA